MENTTSSTQIPTSSNQFPESKTQIPENEIDIRLICEVCGTEQGFTPDYYSLPCECCHRELCYQCALETEEYEDKKCPACQEECNEKCHNPSSNCCCDSDDEEEPDEDCCTRHKCIDCDEYKSCGNFIYKDVFQCQDCEDESNEEEESKYEDEDLYAKAREELYKEDLAKLNEPSTYNISKEEYKKIKERCRRYTAVYHENELPDSETSLLVQRRVYQMKGEDTQFHDLWLAQLKKKEENEN